MGRASATTKVIKEIGEGGMGEVYCATDTKLNRDVALKILPGQFASDSQRMGRFQREAEVLASLDHPNIGQIYGIEEAGQTKALVLQLIEGPTLADKIAQGPLPVAMQFDIPVMIATAIICLPIFFTGSLIARWGGGIFLTYFVAYTIYLVFVATQATVKRTFGSIMVVFVISLVVTLLISVSRTLKRPNHHNRSSLTCDRK